ncbi:flagellar basal body-associated protein FliL [Alteromonadaceae bacterium BrNp21-10]|nr:flagellar basal body-associated protein FliL [Alteromonadaceae bacterium BrNp21-10]
MAAEELKIEEGGKKKKMMLIIIIAVVLLVGGGGAAFFLMGGDDAGMSAEGSMAEGGGTAEPAPPPTGMALYVPMPRPFTFNVPGIGRDRLVQIKVQLMVRGIENEDEAKLHVPLIEGALLKVFSSANADDLVTEAGKSALKDQAVREVRGAMKNVAGREVVEQVLFTGFVMQ